MLIRIKNLRLRTVIGVFDWEREHQQDVIINIELKFDGSAAAASDALDDTIDYKALKKRIMAEVEQSSYQLLEKLAGRILEIVMDEPRIDAATVEVDKPSALRFTDSVSVVCSAERRKRSDEPGG
jgi:FolB domain-containing protein